jgi:hypothetical protein
MTIDERLSGISTFQRHLAACRAMHLAVLWERAQMRVEKLNGGKHGAQ